MDAVIPVICADDDELMRDLYAHLFCNDRYQARIYASGGEAVEAFRREPAELMILDINMLGMSGLEVCRVLRGDPAGATVPIILVSGNDSEESIEQGLSTGANDYILKPFSPPELLAKVSAALLRRKTASSREFGLPLGSLFIGRYEITERIGSGGFSRVYRGRDCSVDPARDVAVKILATLRSEQDNNFVTEFHREVDALAEFDHPNIVRLDNFGSSEPYYFIVMEYVSGQSLKETVEQQGAMPERDVLIVADQVADALHYLQARGMVHRDIKPENIMITEDSQLKLLDFGLILPEGHHPYPQNASPAGTPEFRAPECTLGDATIEPSADVFSLGATLLYLLTRNGPTFNPAGFAADEPAEFARKSFIKYRPGLNKDLSAMICDMMAIHPNDRPVPSAIRSMISRLIKQY